MSSLTWPVATVEPSTRATHTEPLPSALSRNRGGTYSSTVETVRFADGSAARTDLIRLNPSVDTYSLDAAGVSPRQLSHYREAPWAQLPAATGFVPALTRILAASVPHRPLRQVTARLRAAGYLASGVALREHEVIAGTQAAIWRLTNGLELDTHPLHAPLRAHARTSAESPGRPVLSQADGSLAWSTPLQAGRPAVLELELAGSPELRAYSFVVGERTGRHPVVIRLERSADGTAWRPVSGSKTGVAGTGSEVSVVRNLGTGATLASASAHDGRRGFAHYRLVAEGPADRDGLLDLRGLHLTLVAPSRYRNNERVVAVYRYLLEQASGAVAPEDVRARALIGSRVPGGTAEFTPVVTLARSRWPASLHLATLAAAGDSEPPTSGAAVLAGAIVGE